jgi:hypothetical protein
MAQFINRDFFNRIVRLFGSRINRIESKLSDSSKTAKVMEELQATINGKVNKTTTINGHVLGSNVTLTKADLGLGNVDNTSDENKPVSKAMQDILDGKQDKEEQFVVDLLWDEREIRVASSYSDIVQAYNSGKRVFLNIGNIDMNAPDSNMSYMIPLQHFNNDNIIFSIVGDVPNKAFLGAMVFIVKPDDSAEIINGRFDVTISSLLDKDEDLPNVFYNKLLWGQISNQNIYYYRGSENYGSIVLFLTNTTSAKSNWPDFIKWPDGMVAPTLEVGKTYMVTFRFNSGYLYCTDIKSYS